MSKKDWHPTIQAPVGVSTSKHMSQLSFEYKKNLIHLAAQLLRNDLILKPIKIPSLQPSHFWQMDIYSLRTRYNQERAWAIPSVEFCDKLKSNIVKNGKVLSVMSGTGFFENHMMHVGIDVKCTDDYSWIYKKKQEVFCDVEKIDACAAIEKYGNEVDFVFMSWPPYDDMISYSVVDTIRRVNPNIQLLYIGESRGGCTGCDGFFDSVEEIWNDTVKEVYHLFSNFMFLGIRDYFTLYKVLT